MRAFRLGAYLCAMQALGQVTVGTFSAGDVSVRLLWFGVWALATIVCVGLAIETYHRSPKAVS